MTNKNQVVGDNIVKLKCENDESAGRGSGPVQFEKDGDDIFGIDKLLTDAKRGSKRGGDEGKSEKSSKRRKDYD